MVTLAFQSPIVFLQSGHIVELVMSSTGIKGSFQSPIVFLQSGHRPARGVFRDNFRFNPLSYFYSRVIMEFLILTVIGLVVCFNPLSYFYSRVIELVMSSTGNNEGFQSPIVFLQSGHSLYCGKHPKYLVLLNHLTALFYGTMRKSS